jgi:hypothetical protein
MADFTGGDKLQSHLADLELKVVSPGALEVGFLEDATYPDGTSVAKVAAIQEFGAPKRGIPPRPFFRGMIARESGHWGDDVAKLLKDGSLEAGHALDLMGEEIAAELRESIIALTDPPLSPKTIQRKGFATPLIDTGHMLNSIGARRKV